MKNLWAFGLMLMMWVLFMGFSGVTAVSYCTAGASCLSLSP